LEWLAGYSSAETYLQTWPRTLGLRTMHFSIAKISELVSLYDDKTSFLYEYLKEID